MLKTLSALLIFAATLMHPAQANMGLSLFNVNATPPACSATTISTTPAGLFTPAGNSPNGGLAANSDSTNGWTASNFSSIVTTLNFPADCLYDIDVKAFETANPGVTNQNGISVYFDGRPIHATGQADSVYWTQFVTNSSPATDYHFTVEAKAGNHKVGIGLMVAQNLVLQSATMGVHIDRVVLNQTATAYIAEPAGSVDPYQYPGSALSYWKTAIGSGATYSNGSTSADTSLQAGASGAFIHVNDGNGHPYSQGTSANAGTTAQIQNTSPYLDYSGANPINIAQLPNPITIASGPDNFCVWNDASTVRYLWFFTDSCTNPASNSVIGGNGGFIDSYDRNPSIDQHPAGSVGTIRVQEVVTDGAIKHRILMTTQYSQMAVPTASMIGVGWPVNTADYACTTAQNPSLCTGNLPWGSVVAIPPGVNCNSLGLTAPGVILCVALQDYGAQQNINSGNPSTPVTTLIAEQSSNSTYTTAMTSMSSDFQSILMPQLRIVTNNTSANFFGSGPPYAVGGGTPLVAQQAGVTSGLAALDPTPMVSPLKIVPTTFNVSSGGNFTTDIAASVGDSIVVMIVNNGTGSQVSTVGPDSAGNTYTIQSQSPSNASFSPAAIATSVNITHNMPIGTTIPATFTPAGGNGLAAIAVKVTGAAGGIDKAPTGTNTASTSAPSLASGTLSQAKEIAFCLLAAESGQSFPAITQGSGWLNMFSQTGADTGDLFDGTFVSASYFLSVTNRGTGTITCNPTTTGSPNISMALVTLKVP